MTSLVDMFLERPWTFILSCSSPSSVFANAAWSLPACVYNQKLLINYYQLVGYLKTLALGLSLGKLLSQRVGALVKHMTLGLLVMKL